MVLMNRRIRSCLSEKSKSIDEKGPLDMKLKRVVECRASGCAIILVLSYIAWIYSLVYSSQMPL